LRRFAVRANLTIKFVAAMKISSHAAFASLCRRASYAARWLCLTDRILHPSVVAVVLAVAQLEVAELARACNRCGGEYNHS